MRMAGPNDVTESRVSGFLAPRVPQICFSACPTYALGTIVVVLPQFNQVSVVRGLVKRTASRWSLSPTRYRFRSVLNGSGDYVKV